MQGNPQAQQAAGMQSQQQMLDMLLSQAGPRGATYAGRAVQGPTSVTELLSRTPTDAEGIGGLGVGLGGAGIAKQALGVPGDVAEQGLRSQAIKGYHVIDGKTGALVKKYTAEQGAAASRMVDKLDNQYGGVRYVRKPIY